MTSQLLWIKKSRVGVILGDTIGNRNFMIILLQDEKGRNTFDLLYILLLILQL